MWYREECHLLQLARRESLPTTTTPYSRPGPYQVQCLASIQRQRSALILKVCAPWTCDYCAPSWPLFPGWIQRHIYDTPPQLSTATLWHSCPAHRWPILLGKSARIRHKEVRVFPLNCCSDKERPSLRLPRLLLSAPITTLFRTPQFHSRHSFVGMSRDCVQVSHRRKHERRRLQGTWGRSPRKNKPPLSPVNSPAPRSGCGQWMWRLGHQHRSRVKRWTATDIVLDIVYLSSLAAFQWWNCHLPGRPLPRS